MTDITLTNIQAAGVKKIVDWYKNDTQNQQVFRVFGFAGVGKSTIVKYALEELGLSIGSISGDHHALAATFTGKAARVLTKKGTPCQTIHSLIYSVHEANEEQVKDKKNQLNKLAVDLMNAPADMADSLNAQLGKLKRELKDMIRPQFSLNAESILRDADLLILDECFVRNTLIDTPNGQRKIEDIVPGDSIINAIGIDKVIGVSRKEVNRAVSVKFGRKEITCSENHRFFTDRGLVCARDIRPGIGLALTSETMRFLSNSIYSEREDNFSKFSKILQHDLLGSLVETIPGIQSKNIYQRTRKKMRRSATQFSSIWDTRGIGSDRADSGIESDQQSRSSRKDQRSTSRKWFQTENSRWEWQIDSGSCATVTSDFRTGLDNGICRFFRQTSRWLADVFQNRFGQFRQNDWNRNRWRFSFFNKSKSCGSQKGSISLFCRVDHVEILEQGDSRLDRFRDADGKLYLYDIQAAQHSSFSVSGILVHNCSMVGTNMAQDLLSFEKPILVLGDPGQLPPIKGEGFFINAKPDVFLDEIHRQALESPIIRLSMMARQGKMIPFGEYSDDVMKLPRNSISAKDMLRADQVIAGYNATRLMLNSAMLHAAGYDKWHPTGKGEKLICLKNMNDIGLINGMFLTFEDCGDVLDGPGGVPTMRATIKTDDDVEIGEKTVYLGHFQDHVKLDKERDFNDRFHKKGLVEATFGYAITVHKSQSSGWNKIIFYDDGFGRSADDRKKFLYTAITRAEEGLVILA